MKLMFGHFNPIYFYEEDGTTLKEEPEETLEELLKHYKYVCQRSQEIKAKTKEIEAKYWKERLNSKGVKETYIDYDEWERENEDEFLDFALAGFNSDGGIEMLEWEIDLKILHINHREELKQ